MLRLEEGHNPKAHSTDRAQIPTTDLSSGADAAVTSSLPSSKDMGQGKEEVEHRSAPSEHPSPTASLLAASLQLSFPLWFLSLLLVSVSSLHLPSVPTLDLATIPSLHPHLSQAQGTRSGSGKLPCLILPPRALNIHYREQHFMVNWTHIQLEMDIL